MKSTDPYIHYLSAFGQVRSGEGLTLDDFHEDPDGEEAVWFSQEVALATVLGACDGNPPKNMMAKFIPDSPDEFKKRLKLLLERKPHVGSPEPAFDEDSDK